MEKDLLRGQKTKNKQAPLFASSGEIPTTSNSILLTDFKDFFYWWYVQMPIYYILLFRRIAVITSDTLSIMPLSKDLFMPLFRRRNLLFLLVGILIKLIYLPIAFIANLLVNLVMGIIMFAWIMLPITTIIFLVLTPILS